MNNKEKMLGAAGSTTPKRHRRQTQLETIKACFEARPNEPIAAPYLADLTGSLAVHSRVADLRRKYSMNILNTLEQVVRNGEIVTISMYTYCPEQPAGEAQKSRPASLDEELLTILNDSRAFDDDDGDDEPFA
jgi:hypothetical protein